jgi:hypothetical protein
MSATDRSTAAPTGGLTGDTDVITTTGLTRIANLAPGDKVYTLDADTQVTRPTPIRTIHTHRVDDLVAIETRRADLRLAPTHRIPFTTSHVSTPRIVRAGEVGDRAAYLFISDWTGPSSVGPSQIDLTHWLTDYEICALFDAHGHTVRAALPDTCDPVRRNSTVGYCFDPTTFKRHQSAIETLADRVAIHAGPNHHRRPYRFDADAFIRLLGWYVAEGSVYWPTTRTTAQVKIAQETDPHRQSIAALFDRLGIAVARNDHRFEFGSVLFGRLLERLCGSTSKTKRLPAFIWDWSAAQQRLLLEVLLKGDGDARGTYYTASTRLAHDLLRLCIECGVKPRYARHEDMWRVHVRNVNDGFRPDQHVRRLSRRQTVYALTLRDGSLIMAGRNGRFQWVGSGDSS